MESKMNLGGNDDKLILACKQGDFEKVKFLVESKADITAKNNWAFRMACFFNHTEIMKFLLSPEREQKIDITARDNQILRLACINGELETVKFLVENKADITANDNWALQSASRNGHLEIVKYLLAPEREPKADITAKNNWAVQSAAWNNHLETVKFLVENKADITANNNDTIKIASRYGRLELVKFLLSKGADFSKLTPEHKIYFRTLKAFRRWRKVIFFRRLIQVALPLYYSPGFPGYSTGRISLKEFLGELSI